LNQTFAIGCCDSFAFLLRLRVRDHIADSSTPGAYLVPELLRQFQKLYPEVRPVMRVGDSTEVLEEVRGRVLEAAEYIPLNQLGSTDDCGFSPFGDDTSTSRETAFEKIRARVAGTEMVVRARRTGEAAG